MMGKNTRVVNCARAVSKGRTVGRKKRFVHIPSAEGVNLDSRRRKSIRRGRRRRFARLRLKGGGGSRRNKDPWKGRKRGPK